MNQSSALFHTFPGPEVISAVGENIALIFAAAKESGQGECVIREALEVLGRIVHTGQNRVDVTSGFQQPAG